MCFLFAVNTLCMGFLPSVPTELHVFLYTVLIGIAERVLMPKVFCKETTICCELQSPEEELLDMEMSKDQ